MNQMTKKLVAVVLSIVMLFSGIAMIPQGVNGAAKDVTVTMTVERLTIGQGFLVEPVQVKVPEGSSIKVAFEKMLQQKGLTCDSGTSEYGFFLTSIDNADTGILNIPERIQKLPAIESWGALYTPPTNNSTNDLYKDKKGLGAYSYNAMAGWMFAINNLSTEESIDAITAKEGDVVRCQFSVYGWGADIGFESYTEIPSQKLANKDRLIAQVASMRDKAINNSKVKAAVESAIKVLETYDATQESINLELQKLQELSIEETTPEVTTPEATAPEKITQKEPSANVLAPTKEPVKATVKKATKKKASNTVKIILKKVRNAKKYQVQVAKSKNFNKKKNILVKKTVKKAKLVKKAVFTVKSKKIKNKKKLYVRARVKVHKKYGAWSKAEKIKIKK